MSSMCICLATVARVQSTGHGMVALVNRSMHVPLSPLIGQVKNGQPTCRHVDVQSYASTHSYTIAYTVAWCVWCHTHSRLNQYFIIQRTPLIAIWLGPICRTVAAGSCALVPRQEHCIGMPHGDCAAC
jgi:hypothetical protein